MSEQTGASAAAGVVSAAAQQNIEMHTLVVEAIGRREVPEALLAAGFQLENRATAATDHVYYGARGVREWMGDIFEVFAEDARYGVDDLIAAAADFVVARFSIVGRGGRTGEPIAFSWIGVTWFRDHKAVRAAGFATLEEALAAVGLAGPESATIIKPV